MKLQPELSSDGQENGFYSLEKLLSTTLEFARKVQQKRGVMVHGICYWCDAMLDPEIEGSTVLVRVDRNDLSVAYVFLTNKWIRCVAEYSDVIKELSLEQFQTLSLAVRH